MDVRKLILADNAIKIEDDYYDNVLAILGGGFTEEEIELLLDEADQFQQEETRGSHEHIAKYGLYEDKPCGCEADKICLMCFN